MKNSNFKLIFALALFLCIKTGFTQSTTDQNGDFSANSTWIGNSPNPGNTAVLILHDVILDENLTIAKAFDIQGSLTGTAGFDLTVTNGGAMTAGDLNLDGNLSIVGSGDLVVLSGDTIYMNDFVVKNTATVWIQSGAVVYVGDDFTARNSAVITVDGEIIVTDELNVSQSVIIQGSGSIQSGNSTNIANTSTIFGSTEECTGCIYSNGCTYKLPTVWTGAASTEWFNVDNWSNGIPDFKTAATIPASAPNMPVIVNSEVEVFTLLVETGATFEISGTNSFNIWGDFTINGSFLPNKSTLNFIGTCWPSEISSTTTLSIYNIKVSNVNNVTIKSGDQNLYGTLTVAEGSLITNDSLTLISDAFGTARIAEITGVGVSGSINMERYIDAGETYWRYMGSAVANPTIEQLNDDFTTAGYPGSHFPNFGWVSAYYHLESGGVGQGYVECSGTGDVIEPGQGWLIWCGDTSTGTEPFTFDFRGVPNQGDVDMAVTYTFSGTPTEDGWNLVSNPYASTIDWDDPDWVKTNLSNAVYILNPDNQQFATYVAGASINGGSRYIASQQAFWVQAYAAAPVLTAREGVKSGVDQAFVKNSAEQNSGFKIRLQGHENFDEAILRDVEGATDDFDYNVDAEKWFGGWGEYPQISFLNNQSKDLSVQSIDKGNEELIIPVRVIVFENGLYNLKFDNLAGISTACVILEDTYSGEMYLLEEGLSLPFQMSDTTYAPRFLIHLGREYDYNVSKASCNGSENGQIELSLGVQDNVDYQLTYDGISSSLNAYADPLIISDLASGIYSVEIPSLNNICNQTTFDFVVGQPAPINVTAEVEDEVYGFDGVINLDVTGGTPPYQYNWQSLVGPSVAGVTAGTYPLQIVDANDCEFSTSIIVNSQLGLEDDETNFNMVYNQSENAIFVSNWMGENEVLSLYDLNGKKVMTFNLIQNSQVFKLRSGLTHGVYLFGNKNHSIKILVNQ